MNRAHQIAQKPQQRGAALFIALVFLVILTLLSVTAMRTSTMELYMATNEQEHRIGLDSAQSASVAVIKYLEDTEDISAVAPNYVTCFGFGNTPNTTITGNNCNASRQMTAGSGLGQNNQVDLTEINDGTCPPFLATGVNANLGGSGGGTGGGSNCTYYTMNSRYDATAQRGARAATVQGVVLLR